MLESVSSILHHLLSLNHWARCSCCTCLTCCPSVMGKSDGHAVLLIILTSFNYIKYQILIIQLYQSLFQIKKLLFTSIRCVENCKSRKRFSGPIIFSINCFSTCETRFGGLSYEWKLFEKGEGKRRKKRELTEITNFDSLTKTGKQSDQS